MGRTGRQRITIADVAARARVSIKTVSRVLNDSPEVRAATRQRVEDAIRELDFVADVHARRLAARRTATIGLVVPGLRNLYSYYLFDIIRGVIDRADEAGYQALIIPALRVGAEDAYVRFLREGHADGLVVLLRKENRVQVARLGASGLPAVAIDDGLLRVGIASVTADNRGGARAAVEHLIRLGHRRIVHLAGEPGFGCTDERAAGYREALVAAGLGDRVRVVAADHARATGFRTTRELLGSERPPTAVFAAADDTALGALDAVRAHGLTVGRDVAVVGFNDTRMALEADPPLTTVHQPLPEFGRRATSLLLSQLEGDERARRQEVLPCHLVVRNSCGAAAPDPGVRYPVGTVV